MRWITPVAASSTQKTVVIRIPDSKESRAQLRGFLFECTQAENYENVYGISADAAAAEWQQAFEDFLSELACE